MLQNDAKEQKHGRKNEREEIPEPGPPARPQLPPRLIGNLHQYYNYLTIRHTLGLQCASVYAVNYKE